MTSDLDLLQLISPSAETLLLARPCVLSNVRPVATGLFAPVFLDNSTSSVVNRDCDCRLHSLLIVIYTRPQPTLIYSNDVHHHPTIPPSPLGQAEQEHIIAMQTPLHRRFHPPATRIQSQNHDRLRPTVPFFMIHALPGLHGRQHRVPQASGSRGKKSREIDQADANHPR